jgi:hypothetical protein
MIPAPVVAILLMYTFGPVNMVYGTAKCVYFLYTAFLSH